jgi:hypothetical protein
MRRESATVVGLTGQLTSGVLADLDRSGNISVVRAPAAVPAKPGAAISGASSAGWESGARAMQEAARRRSTFVLVAEDPLAGVAAAWSTMWEPAASPGAPAVFEANAAEALDAWRHKKFELPDYYLVAAPVQPSVTGPDFYLGPVRALRPRRVAVAGLPDTADAPAQAVLLLDTLRSLEHGPWWPPLDELLDAARGFYAGALAETSAAGRGNEDP